MFTFIVILGNDGWVYYLRMLLGLPFILFFPGYTLIVCLFPQKNDLGIFERLVMSCGLSIVVVTLLGFGLNYTHWGIRLAPILFTQVMLIVLASCLAIYRRGRLPQAERYIPVLEINLPSLREISAIEKNLSGLLILALLFTVGFAFHIFSNPKTGENFTDFYILGTNGKADNYPQSLAILEKGQVIIGIANHEQRTVDYYFQVKMGDYVKSNIGPINLDQEQKWEDTVTFFAQEPHENLKVEFLLFREGDIDPYHALHIWLTVHN
jgi:uncharacterized membrane protein